MLIPNKEEIAQIIIDKLTLIKPAGGPFFAHTLLYAAEGILSSIELVMLVVDVEQEIRLLYKMDIVIASTKAMSQKNSPFNNINSFSNFIFDELNLLNTNT